MLKSYGDPSQINETLKSCDVSKDVAIQIKLNKPLKSYHVSKGVTIQVKQNRDIQIMQRVKIMYHDPNSKFCNHLLYSNSMSVPLLPNHF